MKTTKAILPVFLLVLAGMFYTGCDGTSYAYIYLPPDVTILNKKALITGGYTANSQDLIIEVRVPVREVVITGRWSLPGNKAYAKKSPIPIDKITDIRIRPLSGYNKVYAALDDISPLCLFANDRDITDTTSKEQMIKTINNIYIQGTISFYIKLKQPPTDTKQQQFIVELITDKNARTSDTTEIITLTP